MKLVPFSTEYLSLEEPLPVGVRDSMGQLLLGAGQRIKGSGQLAELLERPLFAEEQEYTHWHRQLVQVIDAHMRDGARLHTLASSRVRPRPIVRDAPAARELTIVEQWEELVLLLDSALRDGSVTPAGDWAGRVVGVHIKAQQCFRRRPDAALYHFVNEAAQTSSKYGSHHAMLAMLIAEEAANLLGWPVEWRECLGLSALTMNLSVIRRQDQLATSLLAPTPAMRVELDAHPEASARLLEQSELADAALMEIVRLHHAAESIAPLDQLPPEQRMARLLRRADIFSAKISRRATRQPMAPALAARDACLGKDGLPDEIGSALVRAIGLHPPGSFVELVNGEVAIVLARGRRANLPIVASLVAASGMPLGEPALRDTMERRFAVKSSVPAALVKVRPAHERLLAMR